MQLKSKFAAVASAAMLTVGIALAFAGPAAAAPALLLGGNFSLVNYHSGYCLGIHNGSTNDGYAQQQPCTFGDSQVWHFSGGKSPGGQFQQLQNYAAANQECLSVQGSSKNVNTQLTGYTCKSSGRPDQFWTLTVVPGYSKTFGNQTVKCYQLSSYNTATLSAGASGASTAKYADIINAQVSNTTGSAADADIWCYHSVPASPPVMM
jgi:hypothetical protein